MTRRISNRELRGLVGSNPESRRPPKLAFAVSLYRTDGMFAALFNLMLIGCVTLAFKVGGLLPPISFGGAGSSIASAPASGAQSHGAFSQPVQQRTNVLPVQNGAGTYTRRFTLKHDKMPAPVIQGAMPEVGIALRSVEKLIVANRPDSAMDVLAPFDPSDATIAYAAAFVAYHMQRPKGHLDAMKRLRTATAKGLAEAFTLNGLVLLRLVHQVERGRLPKSALQTVDGAGNTVSASRRELAREAVQWWERGAALGDVTAIRLLGMSEAFGLAGPKNLTNAIAQWRNAANRGDAIAKAELGLVHLIGAGVQADPHQATQYFRDAVDSGLKAANLGLATALSNAALKGDKQAATEGRQALIAAMHASDNRREFALAAKMLGAHYQDIARIDERQPQRATALFHAAFWTGDLPAARLLARAYKTGVGVAPDSDRAAFYEMIGDAVSSPRKIQAFSHRLNTDRSLQRSLQKHAGIPNWAMTVLTEMGLKPVLWRYRGPPAR